MPVRVGAARFPQARCGAARVLLRFMAPPTAQRAQQTRPLNRVIAGLVASGQWSLIDYLNVPAVADAASAVVNWRTPGRKSLVLSGAITFTPGKGVSGDGVSAYAQFADNPTGQAGIQFAHNDGSFGVWYQTALTNPLNSPDCGNVYYAFSPFEGGGTLCVSRNATNVNSSAAVAQQPGLVASARTSSAGYSLYKDGVLLNSFTQATGAVVNNVIRFGNRLGLSYYSTSVFGMMWIGSGSVNVPTVTTLFTDYMREQAAT